MIDADDEGFQFAAVAKPANDAFFAFEFAGLRKDPAVGAHDRAQDCVFSVALDSYNTFRGLGHNLAKGPFDILAVAFGNVVLPGVARFQPRPIIAKNVDGNVVVHGNIAADATVDGDDPAVEIDQGAARIAADQRAVGLQCALLNFQNAADTHNRRAALLHSQRVAQGDTPHAQLDVVAVALHSERPLAFVAFIFGDFVGDLQHASVGRIINAQRHGVYLTAVGQRDFGFLARLADNVPCRENVAVGAHDHTRSRSRTDANGHGRCKSLTEGFLHPFLKLQKLLNIFRRLLYLRIGELVANGFGRSKNLVEGFLHPIFKLKKLRKIFRRLLYLRIGGLVRVRFSGGFRGGRFGRSRFRICSEVLRR